MLLVVMTLRWERKRVQRDREIEREAMMTNPTTAQESSSSSLKVVCFWHLGASPCFLAVASADSVCLKQAASCCTASAMSVGGVVLSSVHTQQVQEHQKGIASSRLECVFFESVVRPLIVDCD